MNNWFYLGAFLFGLGQMYLDYDLYHKNMRVRDYNADLQSELIDVQTDLVAIKNQMLYTKERIEVMVELVRATNTIAAEIQEKFYKHK